MCEFVSLFFFLGDPPPIIHDISRENTYTKVYGTNKQVNVCVRVFRKKKENEETLRTWKKSFRFWPKLKLYIRLTHMLWCINDNYNIFCYGECFTVKKIGNLHLRGYLFRAAFYFSQACVQTLKKMSDLSCLVSYLT